MTVVKSLALALALGCSTGAVAASELRIANAGDMNSFIPAGSTGPATVAPISHIYEGLVAWKEDGSVAPMLAIDLPKVSADGLSYVFTLREGVKFHDGTPLDAEAAADSWNFLLDPATGWSCRSYFDGSNNIEVKSVEATGPMEVTFTLAAPAGDFLTQMARSDCGEAGIMAPAVVEAGGKGERPIGTGPYEVEQIRTGRDITLVKYDNYAPRDEPMDGYAGKKEALIDKLIFVVIPDPAATYAALMAGEVDIWPRIELRYVTDLEKAEDIEVVSAETPSIYTLPIQSTRPMLEKPAFRQAMNYALDREQMTVALTEGRSTPSSSLIPASSQFYSVAKDNSFTYDPEKAKALLKEADYNGEKVTITTNKNYAGMFETGVMVQAFLQAVGINAELEVLDFGAQLPKYYNGDYDMLTFNYAPTLDPALIIDRLTGLRAENPSKVWNNAEARELVNQLINTPVPERGPIYEKIQNLYMEDPALLIWSSGEVTSAYNKKLKGYEPWGARIPRFWNVTVE